ncbi:hypothetical protein F2P56_026429 [Juglans regia]|uniref:Uncharacterized protein LOC108985746 n=2 Tax=Juglans regia TaxID=51240 RepID=A0A2I4E2U7_JUGRE|nr:uncharacterized protein LOC108985746 [Juglans regia]KAF5451313.1 hypothetical protein F2P56_026429 [Juglans regia]
MGLKVILEGSKLPVCVIYRVLTGQKKEESAGDDWMCRDAVWTDECPQYFHKGDDTDFVTLNMFGMVYFDDILVYSRDYPAHLDHLRQVLQVLRFESFLIHLKKFTFTKNYVVFLGFIISDQRVFIDPSKYHGSDYQVHQKGDFFYGPWLRNEHSKPSNNTSPRPLLCGYEISNNPSKLLAMRPTQVLVEYFVNRVISSPSCKKLNEARRYYSAYDLEFYALVQSLLHWRHYLIHREFILYTDDDSF